MYMECDFNCKELNKYRADCPYPALKVKRPNKRYGNLLLEAYGGKYSETTAINQYVSHNFYSGDNTDLENAFRYISIVEMQHLDMLGDLIRKLGVRPEFRSSKQNFYWSGCFVNYDTEVKKMIRADIEGEREAIALYKKLISQINDEYVRDVLRRIIMDEKKHIEVLSSLYKKICNSNIKPHRPGC